MSEDAPVVSLKTSNTISCQSQSGKLSYSVLFAASFFNMYRKAVGPILEICLTLAIDKQISNIGATAYMYMLKKLLLSFHECL
jgi:hypothetical protein